MARTFRRGLEIDGADYGHLKGALDAEAFLEDLGIDIGFRQNKNQLMCHCPDLLGRHSNGDASPSFGFNEEKLAFNCFGGCYSGNILELVKMMRPEIVTNEDAVRYAEQFADLNRTADLVAKVQSILHPQEKVEELPDYPPDSLFQYRKIHPYLYERGLTKEVIVEMQVGFDEEHLGITIPHWWQGKLVGMQRRHLATDSKGNFICPRCSLTDKKVPKYKNTHRFPKVNTLYGFDQAKEYLKTQASSIIIVESPFSALKLKSLGFDRVVATFGQFSTEQAMPLIAVQQVYYWPDHDEAGKANVQKAIDSLGKYTNLRIVPVLPEKKGDPGDCGEPMEVFEYLKAAYPASLWKMYGMVTLAELQALAHTKE
jgi:hypothetical protein